MIDASRFNLASQAVEDKMEKLVGPPGKWQPRRDMQLEKLAQFGLTAHTRFLDLGCGPLRLGLPLIDHLAAGHYTGVDVDPECIAAANNLVAHFELHKKAPRIIHSQSFGYEELEGRARFDIIWIFQVIIHLTDEHVRRAFKAIAALLAADGTAYGTAHVNDDLETLTERGHWRHYSLSHAPLAYYQARAADVGLSLDSLGSLTESKSAKGAEVQVMRLRNGASKL